MVNDAKYTTLMTYTSIVSLAWAALEEEGGGPDGPWLGPILTFSSYDLRFWHV